MSELVFLAIGILIGWGVATFAERRRADMTAQIDDGIGDTPGEVRPDAPGRGRRPNRRQRQILASLPVDSPRPTIDDLVEAEIEETGVRRIPGHEGLPIPTMLKVWHRDRPHLTCDPTALRFVVATGIDPTVADVDDVHLACPEENPETMEPD